MTMLTVPTGSRPYAPPGVVANGQATVRAASLIGEEAYRVLRCVSTRVRGVFVQRDGVRKGAVVIEVLRVSGTSKPNAVAGAIAALLRSEGRVEVQAIGPQAVNQAVKALAIARGYLVDDRLDLVSVPAFVTLSLQQQERTALRFEVRAVDRAEPSPPA